VELLYAKDGAVVVADDDDAEDADDVDEEVQEAEELVRMT
jgi:hypothetical protein